MLKKTIRRLGALAMVLAMAVSVFAVSASAVGEEVATTYNKVTEFTKNVLTDGKTFKPDTTFTFTVNPVAEDGDITVDGTAIHYYAGKAGDIKFTDIAFSPETGNTPSTNYTANGNIEVKKDAYTKPGVYAYTVTENNGGYDGIDYDTATRYVYVYVVNTQGTNNVEAGKDKDGNKLYVSSIVVTKKVTDKETGKEKEVKSKDFNNDYGQNNDKTHDVTIIKKLAGDMAEADKQFTFNVTITPANSNNEKYMVKIKTLATSSETVTEALEVTNGKAKETYNLKGDEYVTISGLSIGDTIEVTETEAGQDGYTTTYTYDGVEAGYEDANKNTNMVTKDNAKITVTNTKTATSPTGVIMNIAPYALMVVLAGAFAVVFLTRRNRAE